MGQDGLEPGWSKFVVPRIPNATIHREGLLQRLHAAADQRLILVAAPPVSGKTALLAAWTSELSDPVAWLSCTDDEADGQSFWRSLGHAIRRTWASAIASSR